MAARLVRLRCCSRAERRFFLVRSWRYRWKLDLSRLAYPADGSIVTGSAVSLGETACSKQGPVNAHSQLRSLSLFGGAITASRLRLSIGADETSALVGLTVAGSNTAAAAGSRIPLHRWGYLLAGSHRPVYTAVDGYAISSLAVHLTEAHAGLPAGTVVLVASPAFPRPDQDGLRRSTLAGRSALRQRTSR